MDPPRELDGTNTNSSKTMNQDTSARTPPFPIETPDYPAFQDAKDTASEVKDQAGTQASQARAGLKHETEEAIESAKQAGKSFVQEQKEKLAAKLDEYNEAVEAACTSLEDGKENPLAAQAHRASRQLDRAASYLRSHDAGDFLDDLGSFARRRPEIVFGGLFVLGLASVRFLKASTHSRREFERNAKPDSGLQPADQTLDLGTPGSFAPQPEPLPDLVPLGPPPAFETSPNPNSF